MSDELEEALKGVAMGDEAETARVAAYLRSIEQNAGQAAGQSAVQRELQSLQGRAEFMKKVNAWMRDNPNMLHDDELYARAIEIDSAIYSRHPNMDERRRLDMAADLAGDELGDPESRGDKEWIGQQRRLRQARTKGEYEVARGVALNELKEHASRDPEDIARAEDIAEMARNRGPHANDAAEEQRQYESRQPRQQRGERQFPHVSPSATVAQYDRYGRRSG
jgi:hypothetical protein